MLSDLIEVYYESGVFEQEIDALRARLALYVEKDPNAFNPAEGIKALKKMKVLRFALHDKPIGIIMSETKGKPALFIEVSVQFWRPLGCHRLTDAFRTEKLQIRIIFGLSIHYNSVSL